MIAESSFIFIYRSVIYFDHTFGANAMSSVYSTCTIRLSRRPCDGNRVSPDCSEHLHEREPALIRLHAT